MTPHPTEEEFDLKKTVWNEITNVLHTCLLDEEEVDSKHVDYLFKIRDRLVHEIQDHYEAKITDLEDALTRYQLCYGESESKIKALRRQVSELEALIEKSGKVIEAARQTTKSYSDEFDVIDSKRNLIKQLKIYDTLSGEKQMESKPPVQPIDPPTKKKG